MTVEDLIDKLNLTIVSGKGGLERKIQGCYVSEASLWLQKVIPADFLKEISPAYTLRVETDDEEKITMITCKEK